MINRPEIFVINRLRAKPVEYTVKISHYVADGEWMMTVSVHDVGDPNDTNRAAVATDLRRAAELLETGQWTQTDG